MAFKPYTIKRTMIIRTSFSLLITLAESLHIPSSSAFTHYNHNHTLRDTTFTYEPIKTGLVAFGDSYAAGIGAGSTPREDCRVGTNSYPSQLNAWVASLQSGVDYQNLPCTGAEVTELLQGADKSQIDKWTNPEKADRATLSIGGNDVGFYNVLTACVLRIGNLFAGNCDDEIPKAYQKMESAEFHNDVDSVLRQILEKSGRDDFRIIYTGYPAFFNVDTDSCDYTTFYFWQPGHHWIHRGSGWAYLYKDLRLRLNTLVIDLNKQLTTIIDNVNKDFPEPRVIFVDPNPAFDGHRFCEEGITEPDSSNKQNWFFLADWTDYSAEGEEIAQDNSDGDGDGDRGTSIPDDATCASTSDWAELMLCEMGRAGIAYNNENGMGFAGEIEAPDGTNISTSEIPYWKPTDWVKTFHPRSSGHTGYRDLVKNAW